MNSTALRAPAKHPAENAGHNYAMGSIRPQGMRFEAAMADKPAQRMSLKERLEAFKAKAGGAEMQEKHREKGKEETL